MAQGYEFGARMPLTLGSAVTEARVVVDSYRAARALRLGPPAGHLAVPQSVQANFQPDTVNYLTPN